MIKNETYYQKSLQELQGLAKLLAVEGVRNNTELESFHMGISPISETGDYSDVKVISPSGTIEWNQLSRLNDKEIRLLMLSIEQALEAALYAYEKLSSEEKTAILKSVVTQRTYDL